MKFPEKLILKTEREELVAENKIKLHICVHIWSCFVRSDNLLESNFGFFGFFFFLPGHGFTSYIFSLQGNSNYWFQSFLIDLLFIHPRYSLLYDEIKPSIKFQKFQNNLQAPDDWKFSHVRLAFRRKISPSIFWRRIHLAFTKTKNSPMT